jgi:hypothetical protein
MAIKPHCVVCGRDPVGLVRFADYHGDRHDPTPGWCNELGVTAPDGIGLFCRRHLLPARLLARRSSRDAMRLLGRVFRSRPF